MPRTALVLAVLLGVPACRGNERRVEPAPPPPEAVARQPVRVPGAIDSHVHLRFWPVGEDLAKAGLAAVVDLGAPLDAIGGAQPLPVVWSGPLLTRPGGYPISDWDPGGFGHPCADRACVEAAIDEVARRGGQVVKLAVARDGLDAALVPAAVAHAHARGLKVLAHAMTDRDARAAADAGCDGLAHTPVQPLEDETVTRWRDRVVISTLQAFGGGADAISNLTRLRAAGAIVLYGTDLGNTRVAGVDPRELQLLADAGLDDAAIVDAMTTAPARFWRLDAALAATTVTLAGDPRQDPALYARPLAVERR